MHTVCDGGADERAVGDVSLAIADTKEVTIPQVNLHQVGQLYIKLQVTHWTDGVVRALLDGEDVGIFSPLAPECFPESVVKINK